MRLARLAGITQTMEQTLKDQIVLVTGASRGIGRAVAEGAAARGAQVVAVARTVGGLEDLADAIDALPGDVTLVPLDVTDEGGIQRMCAAVHERWGRADIWVHTAIYAPPLSLAPHIAVKELDKTLSINVRAVHRCVALIEPLLAFSKSPRAVLMDDTVAGDPYYGAYGASKAAARALAQSWQRETAEQPLQVHLHTPPPMSTALRARFHPGENRDVLTPPAQAAGAVLDLLT
ncbi:SDR family NAD(P)-dependent oxidoreductase [Pontivivens insulae]|uniref:SDR family NAD(P)-dependent oxidoreductase n=1 Tax=Pontivivens insulae TaxID=1639689 RepID=UPI001FE5D079|nr:SDR family oxidoreductase [Pontivivens insulae]